MTRFGWVKDKYDHKDYLHLPVRELPDVVDLSQYLPEIRDQGLEGSCVGFGVGGNITALAKKLGVFSEWFSPRDIYNGAKYVGGNLKGEGAEPRDACEWLLKRGCLLEQYWPYKAHVDSAKVPSSKFNKERLKHPILEYIRVDNGVGGICSALAGGYFVSLGSPWFSKWMSDGDLPEVTAKDEIAGGHETFLYGYSKSRKHYYGVNSWGNWGSLHGKYTMPFSSLDVFKQLGGYDAHYFKVEWAGKPHPEPTPSTSTFRIVSMSANATGTITLQATT